jgi:hypothetical protein
MVPATGDDLMAKDDEGNATTTVDTVSGIPVQSGIALTTPSLTFNVDSSSPTSSTSGYSQTKTFAITDLANNAKFTESGIYRYIITETIPTTATETNGKMSNGYVTYDTTKYVANVVVVPATTTTTDDEGKETTTTQYVVKDIVLDNGTINKPNSIEFTNHIAVADLTIAKEITRDTTEVKSGQLYEFQIMIPVKGETITLSSGDSDEEGNYVQAYIYNGNTKVVDDDATDEDGIARTDENGLVKLYIKGADKDADVSEGNTFYLKAGETLKICAPASMIFKVAEKDYTSDGYTTSYTYYEDGSLSTSTKANSSLDKVAVTSANRVIKGTVNTAGTTITFTNSREINTANTGINLDVIPYVLILVAAAVCGVVFISKKRHAVR